MPNYSYFRRLYWANFPLNLVSTILVGIKLYQLLKYQRSYDNYLTHFLSINLEYQNMHETRVKIKNSSSKPPWKNSSREKIIRRQKTRKHIKVSTDPCRSNICQEKELCPDFQNISDDLSKNTLSKPLKILCLKKQQKISREFQVIEPFWHWVIA